MEIKADVDSVLIGRVLAGLIILIGLVVSVWAATDANRDGFWVFLLTMISPLSFGFVLVILSEGLKHLKVLNEKRD